MTIVEMLPEIMRGCSDCDHIVYQDMIRKNHIAVYTSARVLAVEEEGVAAEIGGCRRLIPADHVFLATGMKPNRTLYDALKAAGKKVINTGDSLAAGKIYDAIHTGY